MTDFKNIPIYIISFNRLSYLKRLVARLEPAGYSNIHIVDNGSSYPLLLEWLDETPHTVHRMDKNYGHRVLFDAPEFASVVNDGYFVLTDPDVVPVDECPDDFIEVFYNALQNHPFADKAGFSLKIDDLPDAFELKDAVVKWERPFYANPIKGTGNPVLYKAPLDTTFALYRPRREWKNKDGAIRTGAPYVARHLPWYVDSRTIDPETAFYNKHDCGSGNWNGTKNAGCFRVTETSWVKLCGVPVVKVKTKGNVRRYVLFGVLPCWKKAEGRDA